jgi:hypothetical protein
MLQTSFSEKYTSTTNPVAERIVLSDDAFAIGEAIESLFNKVEALRIAMISK